MKGCLIDFDTLPADPADLHVSTGPAPLSFFGYIVGRPLEA